jgi:hypothetical protein
MHLHGCGVRGVVRLGRVLTCERSKSGAVLSYSTTPNEQDNVKCKGELKKMTCVRLAHSGKGVCYEDGQSKVTLVQSALPGEELQAEIQKACTGTATEVLCKSILSINRMHVFFPVPFWQLTQAEPWCTFWCQGHQ